MQNVNVCQCSGTLTCGSCRCVHLIFSWAEKLSHETKTPLLWLHFYILYFNEPNIMTETLRLFIHRMQWVAKQIQLLVRKRWTMKPNHLKRRNAFRKFFYVEHEKFTVEKTRCTSNNNSDFHLKRHFTGEHNATVQVSIVFIPERIRTVRDCRELHMHIRSMECLRTPLAVFFPKPKLRKVKK